MCAMMQKFRMNFGSIFLAYQFSQLRAGFEWPGRLFRRACCIRTSDTRSAKTVPDKQPVCHNSKAASACPLNANERKVGTMSARRAARLGRRALQETGARLPHSGRMGCALREFSSNDGAQSWLDKESTRCIYIYYARRGA